MPKGSDIATLTAGLREVFAQAQHAEADRILAKWPLDPPLGDRPKAQDLPVTNWLREAVDSTSAATTDLVQLCAQTHATLRWTQSYTSSDVDQAFLDRYGWTLLLGPRGPVVCENLHAGILFLAPDVEYPVHKHSAEEIYVILSGTASWKIGEADWQTKGPGSIVYNPPWQPHGMRTDQGQAQLIGFIWNASNPEKSRF